MTICRKCGTSNQDSQKFCSFCHELLVEDPVEMAKLEAAAQKKQKKKQRKQKFKLFRWKYAPLLLIPIGILDLVDLLLCVDLLFLGIGEFIGELLGNLASAFLGYTTEIFGNLVYTSQLVVYVVRGLEVLGAAGLLVLACVLTVLMIVYMVKWHKYKKTGGTTEADAFVPLAEEKTEEKEGQGAKIDATDFAVSYEALNDVEKNRAEYAMPAPQEKTSCHAVYESFRPYFWEYDDDSVRRVLSAMSCSRLMLCSAGAVDGAGVFDSLSRALGARSELHVCRESDGQGLASLLVQKDEQTGVYLHSEFAKSLFAARYAKANIYPAGVRGVGVSKLSDTFGLLDEYFKLPDQGVELYLGKPAKSATGEVLPMPEELAGGRMVLPSNLWMLDVLPDQDRVPDLEGTIAQYCAVIYLRNSQNVLPPEDQALTDRALPSVTAWEHAVSAAEQDYALSEECWKIIDLLEEQIKETCGTHFANRTLRAFERYTSVYLALGGKMQDALDNGLAAVIVPAYAKQLRALNQREDGEKLSSMLERTVGRDRLPMTVEVLTSMELM